MKRALLSLFLNEIAQIATFLLMLLTVAVALPFVISVTAALPYCRSYSLPRLSKVPSCCEMLTPKRKDGFLLGTYSPSSSSIGSIILYTSVSSERTLERTEPCIFVFNALPGYKKASSCPFAKLPEISPLRRALFTAPDKPEGLKYEYSVKRVSGLVT